MRATTPFEDARTVVEETMIEIMEQSMETSDLRRLQLFRTHLYAVVNAAKDRGDDLAVDLCNGLAEYLFAITDYGGARPYFEYIYKRSGEMHGLENRATVKCLNDLGYVLTKLEEYKTAQSYLEQALEIGERALDPEDHDDALAIASSQHNIGSLFRTQHDYAAAQTYYERALGICERMYGPNHPDVASSLESLGVLLREQHDYQAAQPKLERALQIRKELLGSDHPKTALSYNNMGTLFVSSQ